MGRGRFLLGLLLAGFLLGLWALLLPPRRPARAEGAAITRIRERGYLIVGVPLWLPPFGAPARGGGWQGLDVALARGVAAAVLGNPLRVHFLPLLPGERRWAVEGGAADLVLAGFASAVPAGGAALPPSAAGVRLVGPYYSEPLALLVRRGQGVRAWGALDGAVLAVLPGSAGAAGVAHAAAGRATPVVVEAADAALAARGLAIGRYRAVVCGLAICRALAGYDPGLTVQTLPGLGQEAYWALLPDGAPELAGPVRSAAAALPRGGALQRLLAVWAAGAAGPPAPPPVLTSPSSAA